MLERLAAWFLNTYVAEYVGNLVTDQLTIGLLQGAVELENLQLKKDALKRLNLPIEVKFGYIGKLKLQIPVRYIKSQPWVVEIRELFILVGPAVNVKHDPNEEEQQVQAKKQATLDQLEKDWKAEQQEKKPQGWFWTSFSGSFTSNVIANLQVVVNDFHMRYEDTEAIPSNPFSIGVRLERVSVESADQNWEPKFVSGEDMARKLVDFKNFSVYWDTEMLGSVEGAGVVEAMRQKHTSVCYQPDLMTSSTFDGLQASHTLIVRPISAQLKLTRNCTASPLRLGDGPRFHFDVSMEEIPVSLTQGQYAVLVKLFHVFGLRLKARKFLKWRPDASVKEGPRLWWMFAISCILHTIKERNKRCSWSYASRRARQNISYVVEYSNTLAQQQQPVAEAIKEELKAIEREQSVEELCVLRKIAMARIKKQKDLVKAAARKLSTEPQSGWIPAWLYGYGRKSSQPLSDGPSEKEKSQQLIPLPNESPSEEEEELLDEMAEVPTGDSIMRDRILATVSFSLRQGSFELISSSSSGSVLDSDSILRLQFNSLCCSADIRPRLRYSSYQVSLGSLFVSDPLSGQESAFGFLIQPKGALVHYQDGQWVVLENSTSSPRAPLFSFSLVQEEVRHQKHLNLSVQSKPLDIVYNRSTIGRVQDFFTAPLARSNLREKLQLQTAAGLRNTLGELFETEDRGSRCVLSIMLDIAAPHIIVPQCFDDKNTSVVIFDLGHVTFSNVTDWSAPPPTTNLADSVENIEDDDTFMTPPSSPPPEDYLNTGGGLSETGLSADMVEGIGSSATLSKPSVVLERGRAQVDCYERYQLWLSDLQVLVGKAGEDWAQVLTSGHSPLHVLDKFTLSIKIQRTKESVCSSSSNVRSSKEDTPVGCRDALLTLSAKLPALMFHIDEYKVHTMISCLKPPHATKGVEESFDHLEEAGTSSGHFGISPDHLGTSPDHLGTSHLGTSPDHLGTSPDHLTEAGTSASIYHSTYTDATSPKKQQQQFDASMYHSAQYSLDDDIRGSSPQSSLGRERVPSVIRNRINSALMKERHKRRMSVASEKLFSAQLTIDAVCLSLSSRGCTVLELKVPGVSVKAVKRPFDAALKLHVQDIRLIDRIQNFGPEYELVACASGTDASREYPTSPSSNGSFSMLPNRVGEVESPGGGASALQFVRLESASADVFSTTSDDLDSLLVLTYSFYSPNSPRHPAVRDLGEDEYVVPERETSIRKINVRCTAMEAIANQQTIVELISFAQRAFPRELMFDQRREDQDDAARARSSVEESSLQSFSSATETEVKLEWDRLDILIVRRRTKKPSPATPGQVVAGAHRVGKVALVGLGVDGWFCSDTHIQGKLGGIRVEDLSPAGKKYRDIVSMGTEGFAHKTVSDPIEAGCFSTNHLDSLSFSIQRSRQPQPASSGPLYHIVVSVSMPSIYYTHSVNFIYEIEEFISDFKFYSGQLSESVRKAAVGVARGLVGQKSHLAEGLDKLAFLGPAKTSMSLDDEKEVDVVDGATPVAENHLFYNISIQSPVIVVPSSLRGEDTLVAHLGEISLQNQFPLTFDDFSSLCPGIAQVTQTERIVLKVTNMSLHASHDRESREWLVSTTTPTSRGASCPGRWSKVLKETSAELQIDRCIWKTSSGEEGKGVEGASESSLVRPDVILVGKVVEPLLVRLPKEVFDHIQKILKHGLHKSTRSVPVPASSRSATSEPSSSVSESRPASLSVGHNREKVTSSQGDALPKMICSFSLSKLSFELKHMIEGKERDLVFVSFEDFSFHCKKLDPSVASFKLSLKSIVIEDLLQQKDSEYRYLFASSTKPLPFLLPLSSSFHSLRSQSFGNLIPPVGRQLVLPMVQPGSSFRPQTFNSPLRSFSSRRSSSMGSPDCSKSGKGDDDAGGVAGSRACSGGVSEHAADLLSIEGQYCDKYSPLYSTKHNSVSLYANVEFSSAFVIINLQTWVLLFDYLGVGIPTPPPSEPATPTGGERGGGGESFSWPSSGEKINVPAAPFQDPKKDDDSALPLLLGVRIDQSLQQDAFDYLELDTAAGHVEDEGAAATPTCPPASFDGGESGSGESTLKARSVVWGVEGKMSAKVVLCIKFLSVTFNKPEHPLARGSVSLLNATVGLSRGNMEVEGSLGQASLLDLTETGAYYRERFTTTGDQALTFTIFKYGRPDPSLERAYDISVKIRMSSVRYLHTMRFLKEIIAFCSHFPQLIDAFQRMKAMARGDLVYNGPDRKARISLDVDAEGPILLIPKHAFSPELMVGDIGHVRVTNSSRYDGEEGTIAFTRKQQEASQVWDKKRSRSNGDLSSNGLPKSDLHPLMQSSTSSRLMSSLSKSSMSYSSYVKLFDRDATSPPAAARQTCQDSADAVGVSAAPSMFGPLKSSSSLGRRPPSHLVIDEETEIGRKVEARSGPCLLDCIEMDLTEVDVFSAKREQTAGGKDSFRIVRQAGHVLNEKAALKLYIERNLHEDFNRSAPDMQIMGTLTAIHVTLDKPQLELIKGLIDMNLGEGVEDFEKPSTVIHDPIAQPIAAEWWVGFLFRIQFVGVKLEFLRSRLCDSSGVLSTSSLALFDIKQSEFTFVSNSNQSKNVDFICHTVIGHDTRYRDHDIKASPNVFTEVLSPRCAPAAAASSSSSSSSSSRSLQVQINVSLSPTDIKASILLNKVRLMGIFDLILELKSFVFEKLPEDADDPDDTDDIDGPGDGERHAAMLQLAASRLQRASNVQQREEEEEAKPKRTIQLNLSVTETDCVVVEDRASLESNAVVLKGTLILKLTFKPSGEKLLNCTVEGLELFSCNLSNEDETGLSIMDPVSLSLELKPPDRVTPSSAASLSPSNKQNHVLEVSIQQLNFRLSYNDIKLFMAIAQSFPSLGSEKREPKPRHDVDDALVKQLLPLGFTRASIRKELYLSGGDLNVAASKLLDRKDKKDGQESFIIASIEVGLESLSMCLIDDCSNNDIPLLNFTVNELRAVHSLISKHKGKATAVLCGDYYNRSISAWEPVIEPWSFDFCWERIPHFSTSVDNNAKPNGMFLRFTSAHQLLLNFTTSLLHTFKTTQTAWQEDIRKRGGVTPTELQMQNLPTHRRTDSSSGGRPDQREGKQASSMSRMEKGLALLHSVRFVSQTRQRTRFIPFVLHNNAGLPLWFATLTSVPTKVYVSPSDLYQRTRGNGSPTDMLREITGEWVEVGPGEQKPFDFCRKKMRRRGKEMDRDAKAVVVHQLLVKVAGWQKTTIPVSVDKIGIFFRDVQPDFANDSNTSVELPDKRQPVRLVFAISLHDSQKVVNVRSALVLHSTLEVPLDVRLEDPSVGTGGPTVSVLTVAPRGNLAVPPHLTDWNIRLRPSGWGLHFCSDALVWKSVGKVPSSLAGVCERIGSEEDSPFRFCAVVKRKNYPLSFGAISHPAHTITIHPPLTIVNLLPCDIQFSLQYNSIIKVIKKGKEIALYAVDPSKPLDFKISMEGYEQCQGCVVSLKDAGVILSMTVTSHEGRTLRLTVMSEVVGLIALKVHISCAYWLLNRTGIPLVFKQEGTNVEAAGQSEEHERACSSTPLLFAYQEGEYIEKCTMRVGKEYRSNHGGQPLWCAPFSMISDCGMRRLFVKQSDNRPDQEYQIGVDICRGQDQYKSTRIVTFVAYYQLENKTPYKLAYLQRHLLADERCIAESNKIPSILPDALVPFHWPRVDLDQLLCVKIEDMQDSHWSGGFPLDKDGSFHINIRTDRFGHSVFIRCEVCKTRATYHVTFYDASLYPSPFRLENFSQIPVHYYQMGTLKPGIVLNPGQSIPYAWDEPTFPEKLCLQVKGTQESKQFDLNRFGHQGKLYYENYFYICVKDTFPPDIHPSFYDTIPESYRVKYSSLVLDVPQGIAVIFERKNSDRRSQLWRMTAEGQLVHIASTEAKGVNMVLDLDGNKLPAKGQTVPLVVRKHSSSRTNFQTWKFSDNGRLLLSDQCLPHPLCIQGQCSVDRLREGMDGVLGSMTTLETGLIPSEQRFEKLKHSRGSGVLTVEVLPAGPTRLLKITDENERYISTSPRDDWIVQNCGVVASSNSREGATPPQPAECDEEEDPGMQLDISLVLEHGIGISLINSVPEELLFASLTGIRIELVRNSDRQCLNAAIQNIQVDNQLPMSGTPVVMYPTMLSGDVSVSHPILSLYAERLAHNSPFVIVIKNINIRPQKMTLLLEEKFLFKLLQWAGIGTGQPQSGGEDQITNMLMTRYVSLSSRPHSELSKQIYVEQLSVSGTELRISVRTASQLPSDLSRIKSRLGFPLVKFEAPIFLEDLEVNHMLGTSSMYMDTLVKHYRTCIKSQALTILGSVDFLGNPVGLFNDMASGVTGLMTSTPDVVGLVRDVAHGVTDTTSKLTGTMSHVLGQATLDSSFQEERAQLLENCQTSGDHFKAGLMSLTSGVFGGVTSMFTQPYKEVKEYGIGAIFSGIGKGLVGTVTKPVAGLFDLASGTTAAIRESTSRVSRHQPSPLRHRRCCSSPSGSLTCYSASLAMGQEYLFRLTDGNLLEKLVSYEVLSQEQETMKAIISSQFIYIFKDGSPDPSSLIEKINLDDLLECRAAQSKTTIPTSFIVLSLVERQCEEGTYKAPKFKCSDEKMAKKIAQLINHAKNLHEEEKYIVRTQRLNKDTIW